MMNTIFIIIMTISFGMVVYKLVWNFIPFWLTILVKLPNKGGVSRGDALLFAIALALFYWMRTLLDISLYYSEY